MQASDMVDEARPDFATVWSRLQAYAFDRPEEDTPFSQRLRRETGWSRPRAERAIDEYRRFAALAVTAGHSVSPSKAVDEVWHLHLTETRRYWQEFCPQVLGRPLHHEPSRGGAAEEARHAELYRLTLASYERLFGEKPPPDIWPPPGPRAGRVARLLGRLRLPRLLPLAIVPLLLLAGCAAVLDSSAPGAIQGPAFLAWYLLLAAAAMLVMAALQRLVTQPSAAVRTGHRDVEPYELAFLAGGPARVFQTALLQLYQRGHVSLDVSDRRVRPRGTLPRGASPIEAAIIDAAARDGARRGVAAIAGPLATLRAGLERIGLAPDSSERQRAWAVTALVVGPVLLFGLIRLWNGLQNGRPVAFLIVELAATAIIAVVLTRRGLRSNGHGRRVCREAGTALSSRRGLAATDPDLPRAMALYGVGALGAAGLLTFTHFVRSAGAAGGGSCGGGGGDSGGGGGCGGGGCGG